MESLNRRKDRYTKAHAEINRLHRKSHKDEIRFWQNVSLTLAVLALSIVASLVITLIAMTLAN